jgi:hypothetical protein
MFSFLESRQMPEVADWPAHGAASAGAVSVAWARHRRPLSEEDRVLVSQTHFWLRQIPGPYQPKQLCRYYPRVANAIARCWHDRVLFDRLLIELIVDRRGGRAGFSVRIVQELKVLQGLRDRRARVEGRAVDRVWRILTKPIGAP